MKAPPAKPNIVLVTIDAVRRDHCSLYGYQRATTPELDRIGEAGTVYENAISDSGWTPSSVATLFTGLCAGEHGADFDHALPEVVPTMTERLAEVGYHTAAFATNPVASPPFGFGRGFAHHWYWERWSSRNRLESVPRYLGRKLGLADQGGAQMLRHALGHLRSCPRPFFAYLHFNEAHTPYATIRSYARKFRDRPTSSRELCSLSRRSKHIYDFSATADEEELQLAIDVYDGAIAYQDTLVGKLWQALGRLGGRERTLLIVLADHGESFREEGTTVGHTFGLDEAQIRIPLVAAGAGMAAGERVETLMQTRDVTETVCAAAGARCLPPAAAPRLDLRAAAGAERAFAYSLRTAMGAETAAQFREKEPNFDWDRFNRHTTCIRSTRWKLTRSAGLGTRLQDLVNDPPDAPDRGTDHPELAAELEERLAAWEAAQTPPDPDGTRAPDLDDPKVRERLRGMGYIA